MKKIETATAEQWQRIDEICQSYIENTTKQFSLDEVREVVEQAYKHLDKDCPVVLQAPSPFAMLVWSKVTKDALSGLKPSDVANQNELGEQLNRQLNRQLNGYLNKQLYEQLGEQLGEQLHNQLDRQLYAQLYAQLSNQLHIQLNVYLNKQLYEQLGEHLVEHLVELLDRRLDKQLYAQLSRPLRNQLNEQLYDQLARQLDRGLDEQLDEQLDEHLVELLDRRLDKQLNDGISGLAAELRKQPYNVCCFWRAWSGLYAGGKELGVEFDEEKFSLFVEFNDRASVWCAWGRLFVASANPVECHWLDEELHNTSGPAVRWSDGFGLWSINGVSVDEQIVMRGETQTLKQIQTTGNVEVKRIRIERFAGTDDPFDGWNRYRRECGAKEVDDRYNETEGTYETLYAFPSGEKILMPTCRTGRMFALEVPPETHTCEEAQNWLWNAAGSRWGKPNIIGRS
jgi:hypothetical protein